MSTETTTPKQALGKVSPALKEKLVVKARNVYILGNRPIDLREINDETATALANNPDCMFLAWKDASKRPAGQRGVFAPTEAELKTNTPAPPADKGK